MSEPPAWRKKVYLGLGANLHDPLARLSEAAKLIDATGQMRVLRRSSVYATPPWGMVQQDRFLNAVIEIATASTAPEVVSTCLRIERHMGRNRDSESKWGPRLIDIDVLLDNDRRISQPGCQVPHPFLHQRAFALVPLLEIQADAFIPGHGLVETCLRKLPSEEQQAIQIFKDEKW